MKRAEGRELLEVIDRGVRRGVAKALLEHKLAGHSIYISRGGKVVEVPPEEICVSEEVIKEFGLERPARAAHAACQ